MKATLIEEGYAHLAMLADLDMREIEPQSDDAKRALDRYAEHLRNRYAGCASSEYAVGFCAAPAFEGERTAIATFVALAARAWHTREYPLRFAAYAYWVESGALRTEPLEAHG